VFDQKAKLIENLTGVNSSKLNYYVELKKRNEEIVKQNNRLEIIRQLARDINIDMSIEDIIERVYGQLPLVVPCDFLGLAMLKRDKLYLTAMMPYNFCMLDPVPADSCLWQCINARETCVFDPGSKYDSFLSNIVAGHLGEHGYYRIGSDYDPLAGNPLLSGEISSLAVVPLCARGEAKGLLIAGSVRPSAYAGAELNFIHQLADQLAICIQNRQLYEQVSRAKSQWEETFQAVTEPILLIDERYVVLRCNDRLPPGMGYKGRKSEREKCYHVLWERDQPCDDCPMDEVRQTGKPVHRRFQTDSGLVLDISYFPVFNERNAITAVTLHMKDVTEKTKMEAKLVQSAKLAAIGEMAAGVAHELNNPMTVIIGTAQMMLRETGGKGPDVETLESIASSGLRCKKIIQNLLTFSRQDQCPFAPTDVNEEVERALSLIQYQVKGCNIEIIKKLDPALPRINANGQQLEQVMINLLLNARDALEMVEGDRRIGLETVVRTRDGRDWVVVTVRDNGIGITPDNLTRIFNPFYTSKEATKGTGLGLSVSLGIAEKHGGTIEVESTPGQGSVFSMYLPVEPGNGLIGRDTGAPA